MLFLEHNKPFFRSSTLPVLPDEEDLDKEWDDFIAEYVPEDLTFEEWLDGLEPAGMGNWFIRGNRVKVLTNRVEVV